MTAIGTLPVVLGTGVHGSRPAASAVGKGGLYSCTTHALVYQTDGSSWSTWATLGTAGASGTVTTVKDEGSNLSTAVVSVDFVGAGVTATGTTAVTVTIPGGGYIGYILLREQQTANTAGGTFTSGSYQTRVLTTEVTDTANDCALTANQFVLTAGVYEVDITCPAWHVDGHKARLRNVTDSTTLLVGTSEYCDATSGQAQTRSVIRGRITIAASKTLEVQHQCTTTRTTNGFGVAANMTEVEVYTVVELRRVS